ncbi:hypothetical protein BY996DRAFT_6430901 [Phakopsora pachyrhizi]|uniref:Trafficking protein particle complex subunit n=1 Tax=Phakopsora pachyrhizi TaxID=170000 RepID=A0AAV0BT08_PHAPC|nr:hypothetical protein BY996DRAFT_6430901 [Phakopsora pachyrhizi]CAH7689361.1 hypothetical protein PPACK8108_LOCUS24417 [Phakopsora pachyrhizi]
MTIYSFYIFDRHCKAVYYQDWNNSNSRQIIKPSSRVLECISPSISSVPVGDMRTNGSIKPSRTSKVERVVVVQTSSNKLSKALPTSSSSSSSPPPSTTATDLKSLISYNNPNINNQHKNHEPTNESHNLARGNNQSGLDFDEQSKLIFGVIFSLKNLIRKLAPGRHEPLNSYSTSTYTLHLFITPTNHSFVLMSSPMNESLRPVLKNLWRGPWLDFVARNPLVSIDSNVSGRGFDNEMFRKAVDNLIRSLTIFN